MIQPHGGVLINRIAPASERPSLEERAKNLPQLTIDNRYASDCEMIAIGGFSPLQGFMTREQAESVINNMELPDGTLWSIPVVLPVAEAEWNTFENGQEIALNDPNGTLIALMNVEDRFTLDLETYCQKIYKTTEDAHPGVKVVQAGGQFFIAGPITLVNRPERENIAAQYFLDPADTRKMFAEKGWKTIVAFQTRNPIHRAHEYIIKTAMETLDGALIHPIVGETKSDDIPADIRMRCYEVLIDKYFNKETVELTVLPAAMRYAGPREAIHHMILRKNYGCTHMIVGRDHAGVGNYYGTYEAQELVATVAERLGIVPMNFEHTFYSKTSEAMGSSKTCPKSDDILFLSGTKVREMLQAGQRPPKEFSRPEVADVLIEWATAQQKQPAGV